MSDSLQNHFLVAMPTMEDSYFQRSLIYLCEHNDKGAMGLVINVPLELDLGQMLTQMKLENSSLSLSTHPVLSGGPTNTERGFVLHTPMDGFHASVPLTPDIMLTTSLDILSTFGTSAEPKEYLIALGCAGWGPGQLEQELEDNSWLTIEASSHIIFDLPLDQRWEAAVHTLGISMWQIAPQVGHA